ncbi:hypothetical protein JKA74_08530 [Marivirga sp. S37H4]|uniref:Oxidoreductase n=1 Tax=Marivirga aurantiaca TaxID=2802615 RepID=A0A934WY72_9BACT|nr:hypothetical protein [Marivirga aurantiaca]MBK6265082.1 hypothetical protein [Marivirga aurantiaca]
MNILIGNRKSTSLLFIAHLLFFMSSCGPEKINHSLKEISSGTDALLIGLQPLNDSIVWASGTNATILRSNDSGESWEKFQYEEADTLQFRDIHPLSAKEAIVLSSGEGKASQIFYFHEDMGWQKTFQMDASEGFLDAIQLWENGQGLAYGDAIDSLAYILKTTDFGKSWIRIPTAPKSGSGEGGFASSGSNIALGENGKAWIGTGAGGSARVFHSTDYGRSWEVFETPMIKGDAAGITSIKHHNDKIWIAGGDLAISDELLENIYFSEDNGQNWQAMNEHQIKGSFYGLAVSNFKGNDLIIACGPNGVELWNGAENKWLIISDKNIWTATFLDNQTALMAGKNGTIIKVKFE